VVFDSNRDIWENMKIYFIRGNRRTTLEPTENGN
jgi:hypothetical protein